MKDTSSPKRLKETHISPQENAGARTVTADGEKLAVYIHFPYCKSRCPYCDFFRGLLPKNFHEDELIQRYLSDIDYFARLYPQPQAVKSVFFGGGTPSLLSPQAIELVLNEMQKKFRLDDDTEISLEANPNTFEREKFLAFHTAGINRLSLGVQALQADDLKKLGRTHSLDDALAAMELGAKTFPKFSVDLIYARPNQQWDTWQKEIDLALQFDLSHISLYELSIEEGTPYWRKNIQPMNEEDALSLYNDTVSYLRSKGFSRYEVSNFAKSPSHQSVHNLTYWRGGDYIGIGEGAHGRLRLNGQIFATLDGRIDEALTPEERAEELVLMGLRIEEGLQEKRFYPACGLHLFDFLSKKVTKRLAQLDLLCYDDANIKLTDKGFTLLDEIILELVS